MKKSHLIILIILVVLTAIYLIARFKQPVEKEKRFFKADSTDVAKMEFISSQDTIIVVKNKEGFRLSYPVDWEVSETQVAAFFKQILHVKTSTTPMSEDKNLQSMYKVDTAQAVQVKLYNSGGRLLDHVYIGNGTDSSFDYGRREGDDRIYQFKLNITNIVRPDIYTWRSPNITNIKYANIDYIDVVYTKNTYRITCKPDSMIYSDKRETFRIPEHNRAQWKIINALENLMTYQFIDKNTGVWAEEFKKPECVVTVRMKDKSQKVFTLIRKIEPIPNADPESPQNDVTVLMTINNNMKTLYSMTGDFINRFTRASGHFKVSFD